MSSILIVNSWPDDSVPLPYCDYSGASRVPFINSDLTSCTTQRRARYRKTYGQLQVTWQLGTTEKRAFETFYDVTLQCGVSCFTIDLRTPKTSELTNWVARFGDGGYTIQFQEGTWRVSATLELVVPSVLPAAVDDPNSGFEAFLLGSDASSGDESLFDSDGEEFFTLPE